MARLQRIANFTLWLVTGAVVTALGMRFAMRAVGVRDDIPFPGFVYRLTAPLVEPFYRFFPASDRFDYQAMEFASLAAAGVVVAVAVGVYVVGLLLAPGGGEEPGGVSGAREPGTLRPAHHSAGGSSRLPEE
jgi:uncharacterized protein YggT (Ycf19 family)